MKVNDPSLHPCCVKKCVMLLREALLSHRQAYPLERGMKGKKELFLFVTR